MRKLQSFEHYFKNKIITIKSINSNFIFSITAPHPHLPVKNLFSPNNLSFYAKLSTECMTNYDMYPYKFLCIKICFWMFRFHGEISVFVRLSKDTSALKRWQRYYDAVA